MQTDEIFRMDGSIKPIDVKLYLHSRFGIEVDEQTVMPILTELAAGPTVSSTMARSLHADYMHAISSFYVVLNKKTLSLHSTLQTADTVDEPCLDLCQFAGLLLIPQLLDASQNKGGLDETMFAPFIRDISDLGLGKDQVSARRSRNILRRIFESHDELGVSDELLDEMIAAAKDGSLTQALTGDLSSFDLEWKNKDTTSFQDAMRAKSAEKILHDVTEHMDEEDSPHVKKPVMTVVPLKRKFTAAFIDYMADTYRRPCFVMLIWGCGVISYVAYVFEEGLDSWSKFDCGNLSDTGCEVLQKVVDWLVVMIQLSTLGVIFVTLGSMANSVFWENNKKWSIVSSVVAMAAISVTTIVPFFVVRNSCLQWGGGERLTDF